MDPPLVALRGLNCYKTNCQLASPLHLLDNQTTLDPNNNDRGWAMQAPGGFVFIVKILLYLEYSGLTSGSSLKARWRFKC